METITVLRYHMLHLGRKEAELTWQGTLEVLTNEANRLISVQPRNVDRDQATWGEEMTEDTASSTHL